MVKITLTYDDQDTLLAVSNALVSLDIVDNSAVERIDQADLDGFGLSVYDDDGAPMATKSYKTPFRLGRILDDMAMVIAGARAAPRLSLGAYYLDVAQNSLVLGDADIRLTDRETDILIYLHDEFPRVTDRGELLQKIWGYVDGVETHTLETHIYRLRQKILELGGDDLLVTEDTGYRLNI